MRIWITKYALTSGIERYEDGVIQTGVLDPWLVTVGGGMTYVHPYWHKTEEAALEHAEILRLRKIESLKRKLKKLEGMVFK